MVAMEKKNKFFFEDKILCIFGVQMNNLAPKFSWGCKVGQISSWADPDGGDRESGPPPPGIARLLFFFPSDPFWEFGTPLRKFSGSAHVAPGEKVSHPHLSQVQRKPNFDVKNNKINEL